MRFRTVIKRLVIIVKLFIVLNIKSNIDYAITHVYDEIVSVFKYCRCCSINRFVFTEALLDFFVEMYVVVFVF